jgi:hypothetical protein
MRVAKSQSQLEKRIVQNRSSQSRPASDKYEVPSGFNRHAEEWLQDL